MDRPRRSAGRHAAPATSSPATSATASTSASSLRHPGRRATIIGLDVNGANIRNWQGVRLGNSGDGVRSGGGRLTTIGGTAPTAPATSSPATSAAASASAPRSNDALVRGQLIGLDMHTAPKFTLAGQFRRRRADCAGGCTTIGGTVTRRARNIISGNLGNGVDISEPGASSSPWSQGNIIGLDVTGTTEQPSWAIPATACGPPVRPRRSAGRPTQRATSSPATSATASISSPEPTTPWSRATIIGTDVNGATQPWATPSTACASRRLTSRSAGRRSRRARARATSSREILAAAIDILTGASQTLVQGNIIGLDATGESFVGDSESLGNLIGVTINNASANTIGGTTPEARNLISGNTASTAAASASRSSAPGRRATWSRATTSAPTRPAPSPCRTTSVSSSTTSPATRSAGPIPGAGNLISGTVQWSA